MGEIGIPRHEFLYTLQMWEIKRIIRGYRRRDILKYQLMRLNAYMACFAFRENKLNKTPESWLPFDFDNDEDAEQPEMPIVSKEDYDDLQDLMRTINKKKLSRHNNRYSSRKKTSHR